MSYRDPVSGTLYLFTVKHMPEGVFYDQAHGYPLFFTIRHTRFTVKHMAWVKAGRVMPVNHVLDRKSSWDEAGIG